MWQMKLRRIATRNEIITMAQRRARRSPVNGVAIMFTCTGESMVLYTWLEERWDSRSSLTLKQGMSCVYTKCWQSLAWSSLGSGSMSHMYRRIRSLNAPYINSESREMIVQCSVLVEDHDHYTTIHIKCIS